MTFPALLMTAFPVMGGLSVLAYGLTNALEVSRREVDEPARAAAAPDAPATPRTDGVVALLDQLDASVRAARARPAPAPRVR